jgi:hypothetical protein
VSNHATWVRLLPGSDPTAFSAILRCRIGHTHTDDVLSDRSALTRYRLSADERAPRKPAETDDIACPPSNTQDMTAVRPPSNLCITPIEVYAIFACLFRIRAECWVSNRRKSRKFSVECSPGRGIVLNIHLNGSAVHRMTFCTAQAVHFSAGYDAVGNTTSPPRTTPWVSRRQFQTQVTQDEVIRIVRWLDRSG